MSYFHAIYGKGGSPVPPTPTPSEDHPPVLLWENPNPSATFISQTVELDLSEYVGVIVESKYSTTVDDVGCRLYVKLNEEKSLGAVATDTESGAGRYVKATTSGVEFKNGLVSSLSNDNMCIPTKIYGVQSYIVEEETEAPELLWTNSAPTSAFTAQKVSVDLSEYEGAIIEFNSSTGGNLMSRVYVKKTDTFDSYYTATAYKHSSNDTFYGRRITAIDNSGITFSQGYDSNALVIPVKIYGVKGVVVEPVGNSKSFTTASEIKGNTENTFTVPNGLTAISVVSRATSTGQPNGCGVLYNVGDSITLIAGGVTNVITWESSTTVKATRTGTAGGLELFY